MAVLAVGLTACGSAHLGQIAVRPSPPFATPLVHVTPRAPRVTLPVVPAAASASSASSATASGTPQVSHSFRRRFDAIVRHAKATYLDETNGPKLHEQLARIARDAILLNALGRGDVKAAQAEADAQLRAPWNHFDHVTRISVTHESRVLVNATVNSDGVYVVAPATRTLKSRGRVLGTLLVSIQDVTGYVKLLHRVTGAEVLVRGRSGHVRTSLPAAASVQLPVSGQVKIAGHRYFVQSFRDTGWGNEPLTAWILERD